MNILKDKWTYLKVKLVDKYFEMLIIMSPKHRYTDDNHRKHEPKTEKKLKK